LYISPDIDHCYHFSFQALSASKVIPREEASICVAISSASSPACVSFCPKASY